MCTVHYVCTTAVLLLNWVGEENDPFSTFGKIMVEMASIQYSNSIGFHFISLSEKEIKKKKKVKKKRWMTTWKSIQSTKWSRKCKGFFGPTIYMMDLAQPFNRWKLSVLFKKYSVAGTWTRVSRVRAEYPNQLDYNGPLFFLSMSKLISI